MYQQYRPLLPKRRFDEDCQIYQKEHRCLWRHVTSARSSIKCDKIDISDDEKENIEDLKEDEDISLIYCNEFYH